MKSLFEHLKNKDALDKYLKHPRHKIIDEMWKLVNQDRVRADYKPLSKKVIAIKIGLLGLDDCGYLLKKMQNSHYPAKIFFGMLKVKHHEQE